VGLALILPLTFWVAADTVWAHGGGTPQLVNAQAGPYRVSAWTQPDPIRVGKVHITVAVAEPATEQSEADNLVLDATVRVHLQALERGGESLVVLATRENAVNKLFYEADLDLTSEGQWRMTIQVKGPAGAGGASFDVEVLSPSAFNSLARRWPMWGGAGLILLAAASWSLQMFRSRETE
jgi:hypothetical protein